MSPIKNIALINELGQVVNHVVADTDDAAVMEMLHGVWGTTRYVETSDDNVIILDKDPEVWTTHCDDPDCDKTGFNLPTEEELKKIGVITTVTPPTDTTFIETVKINGRTYPKDSRLFKENAHLRAEGWTLPEGEVEVSLADIDD